MRDSTYRLRVALIAFATVLLTGCGPRVYKPDPVLISQYRAPGIPKPDETFVYVIRGRGALGSARGVWIAVNNRVVGEDIQPMPLIARTG